MKRDRMPMRLLGGWLLASLVVGCSFSPGYRDQAQYDWTHGATRGGLARDAVRFEEFLAGYRFRLPPPADGGLTARAAVGATREERERGQGWLMLAVTAGELPPERRPQRRWTLALDTGNSMHGDAWRLAVLAARRIVSQLAEGDRVRVREIGAARPQNETWLTPADAERELARREKGPLGGYGNADFSSFRPDGAAPPRHDDPVAPSVDHALFILTDGTGAEKMTWPLFGDPVVRRDGRDMAASARGERLDGAVHVIGIAGGDGDALRTMARAAGGSYVFLHDAADVERTLGPGGASFAPAFREARMRLVDAATSSPSRDYHFGYPEYRAPSRGYGGCHGGYRDRYGPAPAFGEWLPSTGVIGRLEPGETHVRIFPVALNAFGDYGRLDVEARDARGALARWTGVAQPYPLDMDRPAGDEARAMRKALAIRRQTEFLQRIAGDSPSRFRDRDLRREAWREMQTELAALARELDEAQALLQDEELARDAQALAAFARLSPAEIERLARERTRRPSFGWRVAHGGAKTVALAGGVTLAVGALPFAILFALADLVAG